MQIISCPICETELELPENLPEDQHLRCSDCGKKFVIRSGVATPLTLQATLILVLRWIGAVVLPLPGAWLISVVNRFCLNMMGLDESFLAYLGVTFATGGSVPFIAYNLAPRKRAITALVISSLWIAFLVFCLGAYWRRLTVLILLSHFAEFAGIIVGVVSAFQMEKSHENKP